LCRRITNPAELTHNYNPITIGTCGAEGPKTC
jgi:hypothetical protein